REQICDQEGQEHSGITCRKEYIATAEIARERTALRRQFRFRHKHGNVEGPNCPKIENVEKNNPQRDLNSSFSCALGGVKTLNGRREECFREHPCVGGIEDDEVQKKRATKAQIAAHQQPPPPKAETNVNTENMR